ncbi:MAG: MFS transporter, partial [Slackia sp.]|nr:MFS transporter [Slackia sp.]
TGLGFVGSLMGLCAPNFAFLLAARLVQAVGTGIFIPLMMNTVLAVTPKNKLGTYLSIGSCTITFGPAFAPVVCGGIVTAFGWHNVFVVPVFAMAALGVLGIFFVRNLDTENPDAHLDIPSVALSSVALFALSFGLVELTIDTFAAAASLAIAAAGFAAFIVRQLRCAHPLIDLSPARSIRFWPTLLLVTVAMMSTFSMSVLLPLYFEGALATTAFFAGVVMLVPVLANTFVTLLGGRIMDKRGEWPLLPVGFSIVTVGFVIVAIGAPSLSLAVMLAGSIVAYVGVGLIFSPSQTAGLRTLPPDQHPFGVALSTTFVQIAACIGPSLYTGVMSSVQTGALAAHASDELACAEGFGAAMTVAAVVAGIGFATSLAYALAARKRAADTSSAQEMGALHTELSAIMERDPYLLHENDSVANAMRAFADKRVSGMPVVDANGRGVGFLSDGDIMRYLADEHPLVMNGYSLIAMADAADFDEKLRELLTLPVASVASKGLESISSDATLEQACTLLAQRKLKKVPVVRNGVIIGTVNRSAIIRHAMQRAADAEKQA